MTVRIIMTYVDKLDNDHRVNGNVALADRTAPACIDTWLSWVWIPFLSCQINFFVCFVSCTLFFHLTQWSSFIKLSWSKLKKQHVPKTRHGWFTATIISEIDETEKKRSICILYDMSKIYMLMIPGHYIWMLVERKCAMLWLTIKMDDAPPLPHTAL